MSSPWSEESAAAAAAAAIAERTGSAQHDIAVVLGSGWRPAADVLGAPDAEIPLGDLPGFEPPTAVGHGGTVRSVGIEGKRVLVLLGRTHLSEDKGVARVAHHVRTAAAAAVKTVFPTNAAGGLREGFQIGQPVLISDHLNLTATSPIVGANFVDLVGLYSHRLRALAREVDPTLEEGVYAGLPGPHFETPAEIRMLRTLGADLVGMSTVLEAIAARAAGVEVFGLSLVTNLAAGMTGETTRPRGGAGGRARLREPDGHAPACPRRPRLILRASVHFTAVRFGESLENAVPQRWANTATVISGEGIAAISAAPARATARMSSSASSFFPAAATASADWSSPSNRAPEPANSMASALLNWSAPWATRAAAVRASAASRCAPARTV